MNRIKYLVFALGLALSGCGQPLRHCPPCVEVPEVWKVSECEPSSPSCCYTAPDFNCWWEIFEDPTLDCLMELAICCNMSFQEVAARMGEARQLSTASCSGLWPNVSLQPYMYKQDFLAQNPFPLPPPDFRYLALEYRFPLVVNYEFDLWQRHSHECRAGDARAVGSVFDYDATFLTITSEVANTYFLLRASDAEVCLLGQTVRVRQELLDLTKERYDQGITNQLAIYQAESAVAQAEAVYNDAVRQRALYENQLAVLCGQVASNFSLPPDPLHAAPPGVMPYLPSEVLCRRPDIAEAEKAVEAFYHDMGVTYASQFPSLSLTGQLGYASPFTATWFTWHGRLWQLTLEAAQTIFDADRTRALYSASRSRYQQAISRYCNAVLRAFGEVENALASAEQNSLSYNALSQQVTATKNAAGLTSDQFRSGLVTRMDALNAQISYLEADRQLTRLLGVRYTDTIDLVKALGGGW